MWAVKIFTAESAETAEIIRNLSVLCELCGENDFDLGSVDSEPEVVGQDGAGGADFYTTAVGGDGGAAQHAGVDKAQVGGAAVFIAVVAGGALDAGDEIHFAVVVEP